MSAELSIVEAETAEDDFWSHFNESVCDIPELENITGTNNGENVHNNLIYIQELSNNVILF